MNWRTVLVTNPAHLSVDRNRMMVALKDSEPVPIPLDDIASLIIENPFITLTSALLSRLIQNGAAIFCCDSSHMPSGVMLPFHQHSRFTETARLQKVWSEPFKKRVWQKLVKAKITNQADVLRQFGKSEALRLQGMAEHVQSGDGGNLEGAAAMIYFNVLFEDFTRDSLCVQNSALNYGYAIFRGAVARALVGCGFLPAFGVGHDSGLNAFNLADDLIEPLRPIVDAYVRERFGEIPSKDGDLAYLSVEDKSDFVGLLETYCGLGGEEVKIPYACERMAESLKRATVSKEPGCLKIPYLIRNE